VHRAAGGAGRRLQRGSLLPGLTKLCLPRDSWTRTQRLWRPGGGQGTGTPGPGMCLRPPPCGAPGGRSPTTTRGRRPTGTPWLPASTGQSHDCAVLHRTLHYSTRPHTEQGWQVPHYDQRKTFDGYPWLPASTGQSHDSAVCTVLYSTGRVLYCTVLCCTVLYVCTVLYCTVLYCSLQ